MIKLIYVDNEIAENIVNEIDRLQEELNFVLDELLSARCKKCQEYRNLLLDQYDLRVQLHQLRSLFITVHDIPF